MVCETIRRLETFCEVGSSRLSKDGENGWQQGKIHSVVISPRMNPQEGKVVQRGSPEAGGLSSCREDGGEKVGGATEEKRGGGCGL